MTLQDIAAWLAQSQGGGQPQAQPFFAPRQLAGGGIVGQGLAQQQQQLQDAGAPPASTTPEPDTTDAPARVQPQGIRPGFRGLRPEQMSLEERALLQREAAQRRAEAISSRTPMQQFLFSLFGK